MGFLAYKIMSCVILLPIHKIELSINEIKSVQHNVKILKDWDHIIISPNEIIEDVKDIFTNSACKNIKYIGLSKKHFKSVTSYDQMLIKSWFYKLFMEYKYLLITQPDVIIFRDELRKWMGKEYDYIGAPWVINSKNSKESYYVGNGGISLRKIDSYIDSLKSLKLVKCPEWYLEIKKVPRIFMGIAKYCFGFNKLILFPKTHEDFFWSQLIPSTNIEFKVAPVEDSFKFAIETFKQDSHENISIDSMPFAIHGWEKHASKELILKIESLIDG